MKTTDSIWNTGGYNQPSNKNIVKVRKKIKLRDYHNTQRLITACKKKKKSPTSIRTMTSYLKLTLLYLLLYNYKNHRDRSLALWEELIHYVLLVTNVTIYRQISIQQILVILCFVKASLWKNPKKNHTSLKNTLCELYSNLIPNHERNNPWKPI